MEAMSIPPPTRVIIGVLVAVLLTFKLEPTRLMAQPSKVKSEETVNEVPINS